MDEKYTGYHMSAPGHASAARSYECPGEEEEFPHVDDYRTDIDFESEEMIGGVVYDVMSADLPHTRRNGHLDYLLQGLANITVGGPFRFVEKLRKLRHSERFTRCQQCAFNDLY